jgi:hypothetical protein
VHALQGAARSAKLQRMSIEELAALDVATITQRNKYSSRMEFLYNAVEDAQNTIRFIDTKAAFCVTLVSAMTAGVLQGHHAAHSVLDRTLISLFLGLAALTLLVSMRVIFPVIKPPSDHSLHTTRTIPKFFVSHHRSHHWLRHTFTNDAENVLSEDRGSYTASVKDASDDDLLIAMCDELLMVSLIRQIKSDRLHTAMYSVTAAIAVFATVMLS